MTQPGALSAFEETRKLLVTNKDRLALHVPVGFNLCVLARVNERLCWFSLVPSHESIVLQGPSHVLCVSVHVISHRYSPLG
jgi:hypothetical protein